MGETLGGHGSEPIRLDDLVGAFSLLFAGGQSESSVSGVAAQLTDQIVSISYYALKDLMTGAAFAVAMSMQTTGETAAMEHRAQVLALNTLSEFGEANYPDEMRLGGGLHNARRQGFHDAAQLQALQQLPAGWEQASGE